MTTEPFSPETHPVSAQPVIFRVEFPFPLPTWNRILAMRLHYRLHLKSLTKELSCIFIRSASGSPTSTDNAPSGASTRSLLVKYYKAMGRKSSPA